MKASLMAAVAIVAAYGSSAHAGEGGQEPTHDSIQAPRTVAAQAPDYRFEIVGGPRQNGGIGKMHSADSESLVFLRLVRIRDGAPVPDANVALVRVDMAPDGMSGMTARSYVRPYDGPGTYRVEMHPAMPGLWAVTVAARGTDQSETIRQTLAVVLAK